MCIVWNIKQQLPNHSRMCLQNMLISPRVLDCEKPPHIQDYDRPGLILGLRPANERRRYKVTPSLIGWVQT